MEAFINRSAIRHLATNYKGIQCAAATFERLVSVWDLNSGEKISQFDTFLDFGGCRLVISEDGGLVATGAYERYGIAMYKSSDGSLLWQRPDLKKVQQLKFEPWEGNLFACFDDAPCHLLDAQTGNTIRRFKSVTKVVSSPYHTDVVALEKKGKIHIIQNSTSKEIFTIEKETFAVLSMSFSPDAIYISESGGSLRCFDFKECTLRWQNNPPKGRHFLRVAFGEKMRMIFGVAWSFETGGNKEIYRLDASTGEVRDHTEILGLAAETEFALGGNVLVTSDGDIYGLFNSQGPVVQKHLDFPQNAY